MESGQYSSTWMVHCGTTIRHQKKYFLSLRATGDPRLSKAAPAFDAVGALLLGSIHRASSGQANISRFRR
jgi:hypothetical protein